MSADGWAVTIPTVREEGAEIWVTWNPDRKKSATYLRFRQNPPAGSKIIEMNWRDNPFFPEILNTTRLDDLANRPDQYDWVWNGGSAVADSVRVVEAFMADSLWVKLSTVGRGVGG